MKIIDLLNLVITIILSLCTLAIILSVSISFLEDKEDHLVKKQTKSLVETGTMFLFFVFFYLIVKNNFGSITFIPQSLELTNKIICTLVIILGTYVNVRGRLELGQNWANQIKIYQDHKLKTNGMYRLVRHPLYASLIWIFMAGSLIFSNLFAFILTLFVFLPLMYYRASQEESLLLKSFPDEYKKYQSKVRMFIPKIL